MKSKFIFTIILLLVINLLQGQKKNSFTLLVFQNLESLKCYDRAIDEHIMQSGYFESVGRKDNFSGYQTFSNLKDFIHINSYDDAIGYHMVSSSPDVYKFLRKNGQYKGITTDLYYKTNLVYIYNNSEFNIYNEEVENSSIITYGIWSRCDK